MGCAKTPKLKYNIRTKKDSNLRYLNPLVFRTDTLNHSFTCPLRRTTHTQAKGTLNPKPYILVEKVLRTWAPAASAARAASTSM